jgi:hypothetical protein
MPVPHPSKIVLTAAAALGILCGPMAHAGPPFQTDDPEPVEYHHFEMYAFTLVDSTGSAGGTVLAAPAYEVNYGAAPNLQLHLVVPMTTVFQPMNEPTNFGIGDTELGFKYRFVPETKHVPQIGIFPFFEFPTGNSERALGVGKTWYRMPVWLQKSWGPEERKWTTYGGAGYTIVPQDGYSNFPFAGWLVQRDLSKKLTLGTELFGHGATSPDAARSSTLLDLGGIYEFKEGFDLLFCGGRAIHGQPETYGYLALYWTWGPGGAGEGEKSGAKDTGTKASSGSSKLFPALNRFRPR